VAHAGSGVGASGPPTLSLVVSALAGRAARAVLVDGRVYEGYMAPSAAPSLVRVTMRAAAPAGASVTLAADDIVRLDAAPGDDFAESLKGALWRARAAAARQLRGGSRATAALRGEVGLGTALALYGFSTDWAEPRALPAAAGSAGSRSNSTR
jgi:hypothetical protein